MSHYIVCPQCNEDSLDVDTSRCDECGFAGGDTSAPSPEAEALARAVEEWKAKGLTRVYARTWCTNDPKAVKEAEREYDEATNTLIYALGAYRAVFPKQDNPKN